MNEIMSFKMVSDVMDTSKLHGQMMTKSNSQGKKIKSHMSGNHVHVIQYVTSDNNILHTLLYLGGYDCFKLNFMNRFHYD